MPGPVQTCCPQCEETLTLKSRDVFGKRIRCKLCDAVFTAKPVRSRSAAANDAEEPRFESRGAPRAMGPRSNRRRNSSNAGKWIAISLGTVFGIAAIGLVIWALVDQPDKPSGNAKQAKGNATTTEQTIANQASVAEALSNPDTPIVLSNPQFVRSQEGKVQLLVDLKFKDPAASPSGYRLEYFAASDGASMKGYNQLKPDEVIPGQPTRMVIGGAGRPMKGEVYVNRGGKKVSNILNVQFPAKDEHLPPDPLIAQVEKQARQLAVQISQPVKDPRFTGRWNLDFSITAGQSDEDAFYYSVVTEVTQDLPPSGNSYPANFGKVNRRKIFPSLEKRQADGQKLEANVPFGFVNKNLPFQVYIEAAHKKNNITAIISNTVKAGGS